MINDDPSDDLFPEAIPATPTEPEEEEYIESEYDNTREIETNDESDEEIMIHPEPKEILKKNDMFISTPSSKKNIKIEGGQPEIKQVKKERKKRVMTKEALDKLAVARAKGLATRKKNTELRKQKQEEQESEKELIKNVRKKRLSKLQKELENSDNEDIVEKKEEKIKVVEKIVEKQGFSQYDLDKAVANGIASYEKVRKERKVVKKKKEADDAHQEKIFNTISRAVQPTAWDLCFQ
tara:strand:- start:1869 stop:2579 length:711 start_codon:yes stop_codon:yes gene_type:complete